MMFTLLIAQVLSAPSADAASCEKDVTFLGFSQDESLAAWRMVVRCERRNGSTDHFTVVKVIDVVTNLTLETYRDSEIRRLSDTDTVVKIPVEYLAADNPLWGEASPRGEWLRRKQESKFSSKPVTSRDAVLGVVPDSDVQLKAFGYGSGFRVEGKPGSDLGYTLQVVDGQRTLLGRFRETSEKGELLSARVDLMRSHSGRLIAVLNRFEHDDRVVAYGKIVQVDPVPVIEQRPSPFHRELPDVGELEDEQIRLALQLHRAASIRYW